jgi:hypothetical protein
MRGVALLSEFHPAAMGMLTNPLRQAWEWHGLLSEAEAADLIARKAPCPEVVTLLRDRAAARGRVLVLREWTHLDYIGVPYARPGGRSALLRQFEARVPTRVGVTVRHPLDHWLSLRELAVMQGRLTLEQHLAGTRRFTEEIAPGPFLRYEDFCADPEPHLRTLCAQLGAPFDPAWSGAWQGYRSVTGDSGTGSRGDRAEVIRPLARKPIDPTLLAAARASSDYQRICALLGYEP